MPATIREDSPLRRGLAWAVHSYTAAGSLLGFLALLAIIQQQPRQAFAWMLLAAIVDATDGSLARWARVRTLLPAIDGGRMDDLVDYFNYVVVPAVLLYHWELLPQGLGILIVALMLISSAFGFCQAEAKTDDHLFKGFPSYWNVVALYLYLFSSPAWVNALVVAGLSAMVFAPLYFVYPNRTPLMKKWTILLGILWLGLIGGLIWQIPHSSAIWLALSLLFPVYYLVLSLILHSRRKAMKPG